MSHRYDRAGGPRGTVPHRRRRRRARRRPTFPVAAGIMILGVVVALGGTTGFFLMRDGGRNRSPDSSVAAPDGSGETAGRGAGAKDTDSPVPSLYTDVETSGVYRPIIERSADPEPLTVDEIFTANTSAPSYRGVRLSLLDSRLDADCTSAVWGGQLRRDLKVNGCSQAVRGIYADSDRQIVGMIAIFNMKDVEGATAIIEALDPAHDGGFVLPLRTVPLAGRLGRGYSEAYGHAMGHYVFVRWAQRVDGTNPGPDSGAVGDASVALTDAQWAIRQRVLRS
ncbi:MAG: hypothetical protein GEV03_02280 [Streptosporangiales bacterium]|nr:hypothetical protein [Streptosporangiales bacterium]